MSETKNLSTKQRILAISIELFAKYGFKDITMRRIAKETGIKASSIYNHFKSKEDILNSIFNIFKEKIKQADIALPDFKSPMQYFSLSYEYFKSVMWDPTTLKIMKIITAEHFYSRSVRDLLIEEMTVKPVKATKYILDIMKSEKMIGDFDTQVLAEEYCAYIGYLIFEQNFLKSSPNIDYIDEKMKQHNEFFVNSILKNGEK